MLNRAKELGIQEYLFKGDIQFMRMLELIKKTLGEPYTPIRRGRRPKNPQSLPPPGDGNGASSASSPKTGRAHFDRSDDAPADAEFTHD
jgi:hypothetical protein